MTLDYYGSDITIYGSKRFNHGNFSVQLDNESPTLLTGLTSGGQNIINEVLFTTKQELGSHNAVLTDTQGGSFLDVDYVSGECLVIPQYYTHTQAHTSDYIHYQCREE